MKIWPNTTAYVHFTVSRCNKLVSKQESKSWHLETAPEPRFTTVSSDVCHCPKVSIAVGKDKLSAAAWTCSVKVCCLAKQVEDCSTLWAKPAYSGQQRTWPTQPSIPRSRKTRTNFGWEGNGRLYKTYTTHNTECLLTAGSRPWKQELWEGTADYFTLFYFYIVGTYRFSDRVSCGLRAAADRCLCHVSGVS